MHRPYRRAAASLVIASLLAPIVTPALQSAVAHAAPGERQRMTMTRADYEACQTRDETAFRSAIEAITLKALEAGTSTIDYVALVGDEWRSGNVDQILDARVDIAVGEVRDQTSWGSLISSLASKEKAQELAVAVAERVYRSDAMKTAIESLATGVGRELGKHLELATVDAAEPSLSCLEAFLGPRYGSTVARIVTRDAEGDFKIGPDDATASVSAADKLKQASGGITGAAILVLRRQMANMARRLGQRLVGSVLSRLVSVAAGGVGLVLIAKDIWDLRHGVLPIIADEMKSENSKANVRAELATTLADQIRDHLKEIAAKSAEHVIDVWQGFRVAHAKVLEIAEGDEKFRRYLNSLSAEHLARMDEVVALVLAEEGADGLATRLESGSLDQAVTKMPEAAMEIARATRSVDTALNWVAVAGSRIDDVVTHDIYRRSKPEDFTTASLGRVLAVSDRLAIVRLSRVSRAARDTLFDLDTADLKTLARSLTEGELEALAGYLGKLEKSPRERVLKAVAGEPGAMRLIASERVRSAVIASRDQDAAVEMMLRPQGVLDPVAAYQDIRRAWEGRVSPMLIWEKHPVAVGVLGLAVLFVLLLLRRLLVPRRRRETEAPVTGATGAAPARTAPVSAPKDVMSTASKNGTAKAAEAGAKAPATTEH